MARGVASELRTKGQEVRISYHNRVPAVGTASAKALGQEYAWDGQETKRSGKGPEAGKSGVLPAKWEEVRAAGAAGVGERSHWLTSNGSITKQGCGEMHLRFKMIMLPAVDGP